jgi:hypothetical protein
MLAPPLNTPVDLVDGESSFSSQVTVPPTTKPDDD